MGKYVKNLNSATKFKKTWNRLGVRVPRETRENSVCNYNQQKSFLMIRVKT